MKLDRAEEHFSALQNAVVEYIKVCPSKIHCELDMSTGTWYVFDKLPQPSLTIAVLAGDFIHNLRSSLDHLAGELVRRSGGTPGLDTHFPILKVRPTANAAGTSSPPHVAGGVSDAVLVELDRIQPYQFGDAYEGHPLWILNRLWNTDKHSLLLTGPVWLTNSYVAQDAISGGIRGHLQRWGATGDASEYSFTPDDGAVGVSGNASLQVSFSEGTPYPGRGVMETLSWVNEETRAAVDQLSTL